jgi:hypothetical protein
MPLSRKAGVEVLVVFSGIKRSEEMATLYKKVEVLGKGQLMDESISEVIDRLGAMRMKLVDLEKELGDTYQKLKGSVNKKDGNRKE